MQIVLSIVFLKFCLDIINRELRLSDTVAKATNNSTEVWIKLPTSIVLINGVKPTNTVHKLAVFIWKFKTDNSSSK